MNYTTIINLITQLLYDWENFAMWGCPAASQLLFRLKPFHISKSFDKF